MIEDESPSPDGGDKSTDRAGKVTVFIVVCALIAVAYYQYADTLTLKALAEKEAQFREFRIEFGFKGRFFIDINFCKGGLKIFKF